MRLYMVTWRPGWGEEKALVRAATADEATRIAVGNVEEWERLTREYQNNSRRPINEYGAILNGPLELCRAAFNVECLDESSQILWTHSHIPDSQ